MKKRIDSLVDFCGIIWIVGGIIFIFGTDIFGKINSLDGKFLAVWGSLSTFILYRGWSRFTELIERLPEKSSWSNLENVSRTVQEHDQAVFEIEGFLGEILADVVIVKREIETLSKAGAIAPEVARQFEATVKATVVDLKARIGERRRSPRLRMILSYYETILQLLGSESSQKYEIERLIAEMKIKDQDMDYTTAA